MLNLSASSRSVRYSQLRWYVLSELMLSLSPSLTVYQSYHAPLDPRASTQSYAFEKEAEKLLKSETKIDSITTIAGLALLYLSVSVHGESVRASAYLETATKQAQRMKLFGVPDALQDLGSISQEKLIATSTTTWGLFDLHV